MYIRHLLITAYCVVPSSGYNLPTVRYFLNCSLELILFLIIYSCIIYCLHNMYYFAMMVIRHVARV
jgi:hypothetical protein